MHLDLNGKLAILADAAKYDASCASSGSKAKRGGNGIGSTDGMGICHSYTPDGRCISLLKILLTNYCLYDCKYCINRISSGVRRARFTAEEIIYLTLEFYRKLSSSLMTTFNANKALLTYPVIKETDTLFARFVLISATYLVIMLLFYSVLVLCGLADLPRHPDQLLYAFGGIALLGFGLGTFNAVVMSRWESWQFVEQILNRPLFIISGVFYVPSHLPPKALAVLEWNPVLHLIEWVRTGYYPNYDSMVLSRPYVLGCALTLLLLGLAGERLYRKKRV